MIKLHQGKHLRITKARGFRIGCAYIPHYKSNPDISVGRARSLMVWMGPYIVSWDYSKRGYEPRMSWDEDRLKGLLEARRNITAEIQAAYRAQHRWNRHVNMGLHYGMGQQKLDAVHKDVRDRWQGESDAVKLREMEDAERDAQDSSDI